MLAAQDPRGEVIPIYNNYYYRKEGEPSVEAEVAGYMYIAGNYTRARRGRRTRVSGLKKEKRKKLSIYCLL